MSYTPYQAQDALVPKMLADGLLVESDVDRAKRLADSDSEGRGILFHLVKLRATTPLVIRPLLSEHFNTPVADPDAVELERDLLEHLSRDQALEACALPLRVGDFELELAVADPTLVDQWEAIEFSTGLNVKITILDAFTLSSLLETHYAVIQDDDILSGTDFDEEGEVVEEQDLATVAQEEEVQAAPAVKLLNALLSEAVRKGASDIHFEFFEGEARVRYRIDGSLIIARRIPRPMQAPLITRIKILSRLKIEERRLPQDGKLRFKVGSRKIDFRVSTVPSAFGEKIVLRILDRGKVSLDLKELGIDGADRDRVLDTIEQPVGMIILTGPTGSGKTTTLYAMITELNTPEANVVTVEDPVEYDLPGITQVSVDESTGMTFERALRAFLRQDPDVILVGEMRDAETATIGLRAAQTGHLVLSTLHTTDAALSVERLEKMGLDRFQIGSSLRLIIAQRLVRKICSACREETSYDERTIRRAGLSQQEASQIRFMKGRGCNACNQTGYRGRIAVYEMLFIDSEVEDAIYQGQTAREIKAMAVRKGMKSLRTSGLDRVRAGITTLDEVLHHTPSQ